MPQSLANIWLHIIFSTKNREPYLSDRGIRSEMHAYLAELFRDLKSPTMIINGVIDHVHILCQLYRNITVSELVGKVKRDSSVWIKRKGGPYREFYWQAGYGVFSVSPSNLAPVKTYILNQEEKHHAVSFQDEFRKLLQLSGVEFDEEYLWD